MQNLLDDLRNAPTPPIVKSKVGILKAVKDIHIEILKSSLSIGDGNDFSGKAASLRRYALWLEDIAFESLSDVEAPIEIDDGESLFSSAAALYEFVGSLSDDEGTKNIFRPPLNDLIRCAISASFTTYQAHSSLIGRRVRGKLREYRDVVQDAQCHIVTASAVAALLGREFHIAFTLSKQLDQLQLHAIDALKKRDAVNKEILELDKALAIGRACGKAALGMLIGVPQLVSQSADRFRQIRERAAKVDDANHYWLADRLLHVVQNMADASMHKILQEAALPQKYRHLLARDQFLELWGPQLQATNQGLLDTKTTRHFVVSIPTGAGKTLFAELSVLTALKGRNSGWAVYLTPSRALVSQVSGELRQRLEPCGITIRTVIAGAEQSEVFDEELNLLQMNRTVTVTTPEKLDAYYRNAQEIFDTCKLVIFDEVHKISEPDRGPLIESLVIRLLSLQPRTRILFLSGVMSNVDEMKFWLGDAGSIAITERSRPTRRVYGVGVRCPDLQRGKPVKRKSGKTLRRIDYTGGLVVVRDREDLEGNIDIHLPHVFQGFYHERLYPKSPTGLQWREDTEAEHSSVNDHAIGLAQAIIRLPGTVLVFMQNIISVERACREFIYADNNYRNDRVKLSSFIAAELGPDHPLPEYCQLGLAYHHARLPSSVQRAIEFALEHGWLKAVFATATLREGMNTTATTVIIAGHSLYDDSKKRRVAISEADFLNLAGRAGRPRTDSEGKIFLVPDSLVQASAVENGKKYILAGDAALRVKSQFAELANRLNQPGTKMTDLPPMHQSILLSLEAAGLADDEGIESFINHSLWPLQEEDEEFSRETAGRIVHIIANAKEELGAEEVKIASKLGLSLSSSEQLRKLLVEQQNLFVYDFFGIDKRPDQISVLLSASLQLPEIRKGSLQKQVIPQAHFLPLMKWIEGESYQAILNAARDSGVLSMRDDITDAVKYASDMSTWLSWSFGAAHSLLRGMIQDIDPYIGVLPLLVRYGVSTTAAAYISLLGVSDRTAAQDFSKQFEQMNRAPTLRRVSDWLDSIEGDDIKRMLEAKDHGLRTELVTKQVFRGKSSIDPYQMTQLMAAADIPAGTILTARQEGERLVLLRDENIVGELIKRGGYALPNQHTLSMLVAVSTSDIPRGQIGSVALVEPARV